jgi:hypothetical protein
MPEHCAPTRRLGICRVVTLRRGTFNLNDLFSRYNFATEMDELPPDDARMAGNGPPLALQEVGHSSLFVSQLRSAYMKVIEDLLASLASLLLLFFVFLIVTFPVTWLLMLFLGNVGTGLSYWGTLPLGTVVSLLIGATSSSAYRYR